MSFTISLDGPGRTQRGRPVRVQASMHNFPRASAGLLIVDWGDQHPGNATNYFPTSQAFSVAADNVSDPFILGAAHAYLVPGAYTITATVRALPVGSGESEAATMQIDIE